MLPGLIDAHGHAGHCLIRTLVEQSTHWISMANEIYDRFTDDFFRYADGALAAAEEGLCDDVIEPAATRQMIAAALEMLMGKREVALPRKHGNLPL